MLTLVPEAVEEYAARHTSPLDPLLEELIATTQRRMGHSAVMLSGQIEGTLLQLLVASLRARRVLEIGTFTGFSALVMAAALPDDGRLITCDVDPTATAIARDFFARSPHGRKIELRLGPALETLKSLTGPFDFVFIDADKPNNAAYFDWALQLSRPGSIIVVDNVVRGGDVIDADGDSPTVQGVRRFLERLAAEPRVSATAIQTVGSKGYDGFAIALVTSPS